MKKALLAIALLPLGLMAQTVNLTPKAKQMTVGQGTLTLPQGLSVSYGQLPDSLIIEAARFTSTLNAATGLGAVATSTTDGLIRMQVDETVSPEGYILDVEPNGITIKARTSAGFYYGFQSIKKMMPANVMAGKYDADQTYTVPCVSIQDEPRFGYRGFMLDVGRHFFSVEEIKRIIDIMAVYKMNRFHWHLTEDQGWRAEIKKYPKLTTIGATASNTRITDIHHGTYWLNAQYGPYYYSQDDMREIVQYCADRHIMVIPEVDMPGHMVAAMVAYPEFSCNPNAQRSVWINGGISSDVLNVANPKAVQFVKDVIDELTEIFPAPYFHIGGDECPTSAWESNTQCQARYKELGLTHYRQLQSHFINEISSYLKAKGKRTIMWNESISAGGADLEKVKEHNPIIMCWTPCQSSARNAAQQGLSNIVTEYNDGYGGSYYINRRQSNEPGEPDGAGGGDNSVKACYNYIPVQGNPSAELQKFYSGVQGTFWCEWVANREYLEYLALPRLMCIAETGWTPQAKKDWDDFAQRMAQDTVLLNMGGYEYGRHLFREQNKVMPKSGKYFFLQTRATDAQRKGTRIELLAEGSPLITQYSSKNAAAGRLWNNAAAGETDANYLHQQWAFEESPSQPGLYAMVCKAQPEGSVKPTPTAQNNSGRWSYDNNTKHYSFKLAEGAYGTTSANTYYYSIHSTNLSGWYMNSSMSGQGFAVNLWTNANDGNGGQWEFIPVEADELTDIPTNPFDQALFDALPKLLEKDTITIHCAVEGFENMLLSDRKGQNHILWTDTQGENTRWVVYKVTEMDSLYKQQVVMRNIDSGRYVYPPETGEQGYIGFPTTMSTGYSKAPLVTIQYQPQTGDYQFVVGGKNLYPVPSSSSTLPGIVSSGNSAAGDGMARRPQGAAWKWTKDNHPTSINALKANNFPDDIYTLSGMQVKQPIQRGIYISGGKKTVVR